MRTATNRQCQCGGHIEQEPAKYSTVHVWLICTNCGDFSYVLQQDAQEAA